MIESIVTRTASRFADLEECRVQSPPRGGSAHPLGLAAALAALFVAVFAVARAAALAHTAQLLYPPFIFGALIFATIGISFIFTARIACARPQTLSRHGKSLLRKGVMATLYVTCVLLLQDRTPALIISGQRSLEFSAGVVAALFYPFLSRNSAALRASFRADQFTVSVAVKVFVLMMYLGAHSMWAWHACNYWGLATLCLCAIIVVYVTFAVRHTHYIHMHHWALALILLPASASSSDAASTFLAAFCIATFAEGSVTWGTAPLWHRRHTSSRHRPRLRSRAQSRKRT